MSVAQPRGSPLIASIRQVFDSAGTELEATSPETDTPARFRAEICYWLYQDLGVLNRAIFAFQQVLSHMLSVS
jgi:hypothetical protein